MDGWYRYLGCPQRSVVLFSGLGGVYLVLACKVWRFYFYSEAV